MFKITIDKYLFKSNIIIVKTKFSRNKQLNKIHIHFLKNRTSETLDTSKSLS